MACEWRVLIEEDKDDSLQFANVFPATILHYTVFTKVIDKLHGNNFWTIL